MLMHFDTNQMNRSVALHNIQITCPEMSLYIIIIIIIIIVIVIIVLLY